MPSTTSFVYSVTTASSNGEYVWSSASNWAPSLPTASSDVIVGSANTPAGKISLDDFSTLSIHSLTVSAPLFIAPTSLLTVTGSVPNSATIGITNSSTITMESGSSLVATLGGDSGTYDLIGANSNLTLGGNFTHGAVAFDGITSDPETFTLTNATAGITRSFSTIQNFGLGDGVYFASSAFDTATQAVVTGTGVLLEDVGGHVLYKFGGFTLAPGVHALEVLTGANTPNGVGAEIVALCFEEGTNIATPGGETRVERLSVGDMVATIEGGETVLRAVKWIGHRRIDLAAHPRPELGAPVRIRAGAFAPATPTRDLVVSPDHCLLVDGMLVPAKLLVNGASIVQELDRRAVSYFHVELDRHAIVLAEGLPAESYLDTGNRAFFANAGLALVLHPEFNINTGLRRWEQDACAPLALSEAAVGPIWTRLAERAAALGRVAPAHATTEDADLHLLANGRALRPVAVEGNRHVFVLPRGSQDVTIASRIGFVTDSVPYSNDWRRLGVAVSRIFVSRGADRIELGVDHPMLTRGWHGAEQAGGDIWRWTDGSAHLPIPESDTGIVTVELELRGPMTYRLEEAARIAA